MDDVWITSPAARRILLHWADPRPAWVWSQDGATCLWHNRAATLFGARMKKSGLKLAPVPAPIKGQVARAIRLGSSGRSSLSRMQFLAGGRPASATTIVTPLEDREGRPIALVVAVDAIDAGLLASATASVSAGWLLPQDAGYVLTDPAGEVVEATPDAAEALDSMDTESGGAERIATRYKASPQGHQLVLLAGGAKGPPRIDDIRNEEGLGDRKPSDRPVEHAPEQQPLPGFDPLPVVPNDRDDLAIADEPAADATGDGRLSSLFDRLADTEALYAGLPKAVDDTTPEAIEPRWYEPPDDEKQPGVDEPPTADVPAGVAEEAVSSPARAEPDVIAAVIEFEDDLEADQPQSVSYRITGRGFTPLPMDALPADGENSADDEMERASRYNFSELGRILSDRVASDPTPPGPPEEIEAAPPAMTVATPAASSDRALINIAAETFILNRLPLGIMVFRDQQVLFANRALTDILGHANVDSLRAAGLTSVFPSDETASAGPVTHLVRRDGTLIPVTARLQSITWQGRPGLMLSALSAEPATSHEVVVRDFAAALARLRNEGFVMLDRAGTIASLSDRGALLFGSEANVGTALATLLDDEQARSLRAFLERPARFAETERPAIELKGPSDTTITLFAEGMAGIVSGYFGLIMAAPKTEAPGAAGEDPSMLGRVSRGVRRPLNTIIGFSDLIRSAAFGTIENHRYLEYARDIKTAGQEIAVLVDELDDYARLKAGTFELRPADLDLAALLESCMLRVRGQANATRVLVRSAISEDLPHIRADRASLGQAVLNLLASAIDQTPSSGSVILSAQTDDAGGVVINVRDSGAAGVDPGERFVVFRDGVGKDGEPLAPVRSSVGLALTRSLIAVNACTLAVVPAGSVGTIFSVSIPADLVGPIAARG